MVRPIRMAAAVVEVACADGKLSWLLLLLRAVNHAKDWTMSGLIALRISRILSLHRSRLCFWAENWTTAQLMYLSLHPC